MLQHLFGMGVRDQKRYVIALRDLSDSPFQLYIIEYMNLDRLSS